jgi:glutamate dehydrogenase/leucine dehydrogenase
MVREKEVEFQTEIQSVKQRGERRRFRNGIRMRLNFLSLGYVLGGWRFNFRQDEEMPRWSSGMMIKPQVWGLRHGVKPHLDGITTPGSFYQLCL